MTFILSSCENIVLWRGHFNASGDEKSMNLSINGGEGEISEDKNLRYLTRISPSAFAASVWLNDVFLNTSYGKYVSILILYMKLILRPILRLKLYE